jgi:hypothetical protein
VGSGPLLPAVPEHAGRNRGETARLWNLCSACPCCGGSTPLSAGNLRGSSAFWKASLHAYSVLTASTLEARGGVQTSRMPRDHEVLGANLRESRRPLRAHATRVRLRDSQHSLRRIMTLSPECIAPVAMRPTGIRARPLSTRSVPLERTRSKSPLAQSGHDRGYGADESRLAAGGKAELDDHRGVLPDTWYRGADAADHESAAPRTVQRRRAFQRRRRFQAPVLLLRRSTGDEDQRKEQEAGAPPRAGQAPRCPSLLPMPSGQKIMQLRFMSLALIARYVHRSSDWT